MGLDDRGDLDQPATGDRTSSRSTTAGSSAAFDAGALAVTWAAPSDTGGVPLQGYQVSLDGAARQVVGLADDQVQRLPGGSHTVAVMAINTKGVVGSAAA